MRADAILTNMTVGLCPLNCEFDNCNDQEHDAMATPGGNDGGEERTCAWGSAGCEAHNCSTSFTPEEGRALDQVLPLLDGKAIRALEAQYAVFTVNQERETIQMPRDVSAS